MLLQTTPDVPRSAPNCADAFAHTPHIAPNKKRPLGGFPAHGPRAPRRLEAESPATFGTPPGDWSAVRPLKQGQIKQLAGPAGGSDGGMRCSIMVSVCFS